MNSDMNSSQARKNLAISNEVMQSELTSVDKIPQLAVPPFVISKEIPKDLDIFLKKIYSGYSDLEEKFKIDIKGTSESFIPDTRIPLQLLIDADGISYYLKSRIVPTAAKVDSALKHISELVQGTFTVSKLVPNIDRIKLLLGDNIRIPEKIPELQK